MKSNKLFSFSGQQVPIPVSDGGTGTSTAFTQGSIIFADGGGVYAQDNAGLFWDDTNNYFGLNTNAPTAAFTLGSVARSGTPSAAASVVEFNAATFTDTNAAASGTVSNFVNYRINRPTLAATNSNVTTTNAINLRVNGGPVAGTNETITNSYGVYLSDSSLSGTITNSYSLYCGVMTGATNNYSAYFAGGVGIGATDPTSQLVIASTNVTVGTDEQVVLRSKRAAIVTGNMIGGIAYRSNDTTLTAPGTKVCLIDAVAEATHTASVLDTGLVFHTTVGTTMSEKFKITGAGNLVVPTTVTGAGTTGNQTINKVSGTVNFAAAATTLTVTNSLVTANSIVLCVVRTNDTTATLKNVVPGSGSFVITLGAAATAETSVGFLVIN